ncbi:histone-fold-containing protein, partial [Vararia minispora EC-137]
MKKGNKTTKFPVARIKKIMQKDEEVGKVAQATPVVICAQPFSPRGSCLIRSSAKALELFLAMIVDEAGKVTVSRNSKKVEAYHLKHAIETCEMLDFLKEIVVNVPDPSAGGTIALEGENVPKKRGRKRG